MYIYTRGLQERQQKLHMVKGQIMRDAATEKYIYPVYTYNIYVRRYFQHAHFIPIVGVGKRGEN